MSRNLLVCCDGTWNDAEKKKESERSNVWRFYQQAAGVSGETKQYYRGVGTRNLKDLFKGGLWGFGIGESIREAYGWLATHYQPGDKIFLVGFSRGAFTVRSLAGMIGSRGLNPELTQLEGTPYRDCIAKEYQAYRRQEKADRREPGIHFVGVFDTVGKLGVPNRRRFANIFDKPNKWAFHNTQLGAHVTHGRHAIAIDECRAEFMPTLWVDDADRPIYALQKDGRSVEQVWFCGQHSDIGGAHPPITNIALSWMLQEARHCGLEIDPDAIQNLEGDATAKLSDASFSLTLMPRGVPRLRLNQGPDKIIHRSVTERCEADPAYWPTRLLDTDPLSLTVTSAPGRDWHLAGVWLENGQTFIAKTAGQRGENSVSGFIANGGNPKIDGTWPDHENFALNQPFTIKHGSGYVYFRMRPRHVMHNWKAWATRSNWSLTVTLEQMYFGADRTFRVNG